MSMEIRTAGEAERGALTAFFAADPQYSLFYAGNLQAMGFGHPDLEYWALYQEGELAAVLMRYTENWSILTSDESLDLSPLIAIIDEYEVVNRLTGKEWIVDRILAGLTRHAFVKLNHDFFCALKEENFLPVEELDVRPLVLEDEQRVHDHYVGGEMAHIDGQTFRKRMVDGKLRGFVVEKDGQLLSIAMTLAETNLAAMIGSVYTPAEHRGRGYASRVMSALCRALLAEQKEPCLFYDDPTAGKIYRRMGFHDIGMFKMAGKM